ncbi:hypothetical protein [Propionispora vibrioides]|uniref:hypothetical protein n=1 Tax=Propionispora vibrioides TaxID=112903 RepID=UPI0015A55B75|nr:hypothetical protein [Propionispora vibrioides]
MTTYEALSFAHGFGHEKQITAPLKVWRLFSRLNFESTVSGCSLGLACLQHADSF